MPANEMGRGFNLPDPERTEETLAPIPELTDGGEWVLVDSPHPLDSHAGLDPTAGGEMQVPLHVDTPAAALIRNHEMGHARWTPRGMPPAMAADFAMQLAEDSRIWRRLASSGVDMTAAGMPPNEMRQRVSDPGVPPEYLLGLIVATSGTGDRDDMRQAVRTIRPDGEDLIRKADAILGRYMSDPWPTFADTIAAADCIRNCSLPPDEESPEGGPGQPGADGTDPGEGQGSSPQGSEGQPGEGDPGEGNGEGQPGEGDPGEGNGAGDSDSDSDSDRDTKPGASGSEGQPGEGKQPGESKQGSKQPGEGKPQGNSPGEWQGPKGSDEGPGQEHEAGEWRKPLAPLPSGWKPRPWEGTRPTGSKRAGITRKLNSAAAENEAKVKAAAEDLLAASQLSPAERAAGNKTAEGLMQLAGSYSWADGDLVAGEMQMATVPLPHRLPAKLRGSNYRPTNYGGRIGSAARVNTDGVLFRAKRNAVGGGSVLIDCSGSMSLDDSEVMAILLAAPAVTIATYAGSDTYGELRIIARNGRRADSDDFQPRGYGGNVVDIPALEWLGQQSSRPRIWGSDGIVTGAGDCVGESLFRQAAAVCKRYGIHRAESISELMALAKTKGR